MEVRRFYTFKPVTLKNDSNKYCNEYNYNKLYEKCVHSAYVYHDTYLKYCDNLFELWNILNENDGTKMETIEDHEDETVIVYINDENEIKDAQELFNIDLNESDYSVSSDFHSMIWE